MSEEQHEDDQVQHKDDGQERDKLIFWTAVDHDPEHGDICWSGLIPADHPLVLGQEGRPSRWRRRRKGDHPGRRPS